ncbi:hypothetical protein [Halalkalibacter lacteus]|uniref:capsular polysaccharide export protein, LipB/KpsS family n=1 Tax=Halalkalibacter lacteus TaxID=3090663 RepID=UPI002FC9B642
MANYLFLRGNRNKRFFIDIASELIQRGHHCFQMKFELGELLFKSGIKTLYAPSAVSKKQYPISDDELLTLPIYNITFKRTILKKRTSKSELEMYKRYMYVIDQYIKNNHIDVICLFNGYHWIDQVTKYIATKYGLQIRYFEDGLFRPYTITYDSNGINAKASVPKDPDFYDRIEVNEERYRKYLFHPENAELTHRTKESLIKVALIKLVSMLGAVFRLNPRLYDHINFWEASKYFVTKKLFSRREEDIIDWPAEYVFVPFQVARDSQIFYNSPNVKTMEMLLKVTVQAVKSVNEKENRNIKVIIKEHPEDMSRNSYHDLKQAYKQDETVLFVKKFNVHKLIKHATAVITINSTVGIEALAHHKRVITLGNSLYNIEGITSKCDQLDQLDEVLLQSLQKPVNTSRIDKFLYYLRFKYQVEGTINFPNKATAKNVVDRMLLED